MDTDVSNSSLDPADVFAKLQEELANSKASLIAALEPLKHGEKTRLILSMIEYPAGEASQFKDEPHMRIALSHWRRVHDVQVALGVHVTLESYYKNALQAQGGNTNVEKQPE